MKRFLSYLILITMMAMCVSCCNKCDSNDKNTEALVVEMQSLYPEANHDVMKRGVEQVAALWQEQDGTDEEFAQFVKDNYVADAEARKVLFDKLSKVYEVLLGATNQVAVELNLPTMLSGPEPIELDYIMSAFNPFSHLTSSLRPSARVVAKR